jgi:hypothetical protein
MSKHPPADNFKDYVVTQVLDGLLKPHEIEHYKIIVREDGYKFMDAVNDAIKQGYIPQGGAFKVGIDQYGQALVKLK